MRVNKLRYNQELVDFFNEYRLLHTTRPEKAIFQVSTDDFHYNCGFTKNKLLQNIEKYKIAIGNNCDFRFQNLGNGLMVIGRAKQINDISAFDNIDKVIIPNLSAIHRIEFRKRCEGSQNTCNNGISICNCVVNDIFITPNGYIYNRDVEAFNALYEDNYINALGNITNDSIYYIINKYLKKNGNNHLSCETIFKDANSLVWQTQHLLYKYLLLKKNIIESFLGSNPFKYYDSRKKYYNCLDILNNRIKTIRDEESSWFYYGFISNLISNEMNSIHEIAIKYFKQDSNKEIYKDKLVKLLKVSPICEDNFFNNIGINYKDFLKLMECYYDCNFDEYKNISDKITVDGKFYLSNIKQK